MDAKTDLKTVKWNGKFEPLIGVEELSVATGMTVSFIRKAIRVYDMPYYKIGGLIKFRLSEVNSWIQNRRVAG